MECQKCQQRPANVHITKLVNGKKTEYHLCDHCAKSENISINNIELPQFPLHNLNSLLGALLAQPFIAEQQGTHFRCPSCQISYNKITELGHVGCSECYKHFSTHLDPTLRKIHGSSQHQGKIPKRAGASFYLKREVEELRKGLKAAVEREEYEEAALIRDRIKELEEKTGERGM